MREIERGIYGEYILTDEEHIQAAKDILLEILIDKIRELAKEDDFWIIKTAEDHQNAPLSKILGVPKEAEGKATVAWKIQIPQMQK